MSKKSLEKLRILVVDDEPSICEVLSDLLEGYVKEVQVAYNGNHAFEKIKEDHFDFVLSDVRMPGCSGIELLKKIREYEGKAPQVVLMSAFCDITHESAKQQGALGLLMKPEVFTNVLSLLESTDFDEHL